jgi:hypothetical protein
LNLGLVATSVQPFSFWGARRFTLAAFEIVAIQRQRDKYTPAEAFGARLSRERVEGRLCPGLAPSCKPTHGS